MHFLQPAGGREKFTVERLEAVMAVVRRIPLTGPVAASCVKPLAQVAPSPSRIG